MKFLFVFLLFSTTAFGQSKNAYTQDRYDEYMQASGKWGFISGCMYFTAFSSAVYTAYSAGQEEKYRVIRKERDLTEEEEAQRLKWRQITKVGPYVTGGALLFGLIGTGMSLQYENKAHKLALEMNINF